MSHEQILSTITADNEHSRLEVALSCDAAGERTLELRRQSWGKGVGWYRQHTLQLGPAEAEALLQTLRTSGRAWRKQSGRRSGGKVIPFPGCASGTALGGGRTDIGRPGERAKRTKKTGSPFMSCPLYQEKRMKRVALS